MDPLRMLNQLRRGGRSTPELPVPGTAGALAQLMGQMPQQAGAAPLTPPQGGMPPQGGQGEPEGPAEPGGDTSDEEMLEQVRHGMGGGTPQGQGTGASPPPGSDMKWMDVDQDRAALEANPSPDNVKAFTDYWGEDQLPPSLKESSPDSEQPGQDAAY